MQRKPICIRPCYSGHVQRMDEWRIWATVQPTTHWSITKKMGRINRGGQQTALWLSNWRTRSWIREDWKQTIPNTNDQFVLLSHWWNLTELTGNSKNLRISVAFSTKYKTLTCVTTQNYIEDQLNLNWSAICNKFNQINRIVNNSTCGNCFDVQ